MEEKNIIIEELKIIKDYPNYSISNLGYVINNRTKRKLKNLIQKYKSGYQCYRVNLYNGGKPKNAKIHKLLGEYFITNPKPDIYNEIDHINRNPLDNDLSNLRWCNRSINTQNTNVSKNNKLQEKNICRFRKGYKVDLYKNGKKICKTFKTLEEAKEWRDNVDFDSYKPEGRWAGHIKKKRIRKKKHCEICNKELNADGFKKHLQSKRHRYNAGEDVYKCKGKEQEYHKNRYLEKTKN